jgi:transcriptional regulator with XRE-family HTH domain|tara:strand:+ start:549 stop:782 length:234 start_codon:yes stop_codon:yes gene_type:complete
MTREETNIDEILNEKKVLTDKALAELIGISPVSVSQRLNGSISMNTIELIAKTLSVSIEELIVKKSKFKKYKDNEGK